ncbi:MAG: hypothetical protein ABFS86_01630 [Planctomycetota bacterium]
MISPGPARFAIVFIVTLIVGIGVLLLVFGVEPVTPRKGIRIPTITGRRSGGRIDAPVPGLPAVRRSEGAEYSSYQTVTFPGADGEEEESFEFLAAYLRLEKALPMELTAEGVTVLIFPVPETIETARTLGDRVPEPSVSIRAGRGDLVQGFADTGSESVWELTLSDDVVVVSRDRGREATLRAEILDIRPEERRLSAPKAFRIESGAYTLEGFGLSGRTALQTFRVERDIVLTLPTSVLFPGVDAPDVDAPAATTRITCGGPLIFQRGEPETGLLEGWLPYRLEFQRSVRVVQQGPDGTDRLISDLLTVDLLVKDTGDEKFEPGPETIRARKVVAGGTVDLSGAKGTRVGAKAIEVTPGDEETKVRLTGPTSFLHRGVLEEGGPESTLSVRSGGDGTIVASADGTSFTASFTGGVSAQRQDADQTPAFTLDAEDLEVRSGPDGREMTATGGARFSLTGASGRADRIIWKQVSEAHSEVRLLGSAEVTAQAGANLDPFSEAAKDAPAGPKQDTVVHLEAEESIVLVQEDRTHTFRMRKGAVVTRVTDGVEVTRVRAEAIDVLAESPEAGAATEKIEVRTLSATGGVAASGRPTVSAKDAGGETAMDLRATGERFDFDTATGRGVLTGEPAEVRLREDGEKWNSIAARRLTFGADLEDPAGKPGHLTAEEKVTATVYLVEKEGEAPVPFTLNADRLEVETAPGPAKGGAENRIRSLVATGNASLLAKDGTIRGEKMTYAGGADRDIRIEGRPDLPARIERVHVLGERELRDWFEATTVRVRLKDQQVLSFESPTGGDLEFHRIAGASPIPLGGADGGKKKPEKDLKIERVRAHGAGRIFYDGEKSHLRIEKETWLRQYVEGPDGFEEIARFRADLVEAWTEKDASGADIISRAKGLGNVEGRGKDDAWILECESFDVDLKHHLLIVLGSPATVKADGTTHRVGRAEYDYKNDEWEFHRLGR